jgi:hypothetical protein
MAWPGSVGVDFSVDFVGLGPETEAYNEMLLSVVSNKYAQYIWGEMKKVFPGVICEVRPFEETSVERRMSHGVVVAPEWSALVYSMVAPAAAAAWNHIISKPGDAFTGPLSLRQFQEDARSPFLVRPAAGEPSEKEVLDNPEQLRGVYRRQSQMKGSRIGSLVAYPDGGPGGRRSAPNPLSVRHATSPAHIGRVLMDVGRHHFQTDDDELNAKIRETADHLQALMKKAASRINQQEGGAGAALAATPARTPSPTPAATPAGTPSPTPAGAPARTPPRKRVRLNEPRRRE